MNLQMKRKWNVRQPLITEHTTTNADSTNPFSVQNTINFVCINLLKPTCYVMHHQFNIQQLYVLPTLYLCVLYLSENKQWLVSLTA